MLKFWVWAYQNLVHLSIFGQYIYIHMYIHTGRPVTASMAAAPASKINCNHAKLDVKPHLSGKSRSIQDKGIFACNYFSTILLTLTILFQYQKRYEYGQQHTNLVSAILIKQTRFTLFTWTNKAERLEYTECTMAYLVNLKMMRRFPSIAASNRLAENCFQSTMIFFSCLQAYCDVYRNLQMVFGYNCILKCT